MGDCLFCKFIKKEIPVLFVYEDENAVVIRDINPQAPSHFLVIPREHFAGIHEVPLEKAGFFDGLLKAASAAITKENLDSKGYRLVINYGEKAGQSVHHIHIHLLSGRDFRWPPG